MSQKNRIHNKGHVNQTRNINFTFNNKLYQGHPGDTLASALLANGVNLIGRSFKYHRPRGIFSAGSEEPNALVQLEIGAHTEPNRLATEIEIYDGLSANSQNCWPSVKFDLSAINSKVARILPAGFYYKTFMWPASMWLTYEKHIRKAAGLGVSPLENDPDCYDHQYHHCDVLVIGSGSAGLQAAYTAAKSGVRVTLVEQNHAFGGALLFENATINGVTGRDWIAQMVDTLSSMDNVTLLKRTTVTGYYDYNYLIANERVSEHLGPKREAGIPKERLWKIRSKQVVLATGSIERPMVFADNDRPGVMLASAIRQYLQQHGVLIGQSIVFHTNNDSAYLSAIDAKKAGAEVRIIDVRKTLTSDVRTQAESNGISVLLNCAITSVEYKSHCIRSIEVMQLNASGDDVIGSKQIIQCDAIGVSGGFTPTVHLYSQSKGKLTYLDDRHCFVPNTDSMAPNNPCHIAGACQASFTLSECLEEGYQAGLSALSALSIDTTGIENSVKHIEAEPGLGDIRPLWIVPCDHPIGQGKKKHFHELHNDSTIADVILAQREGFESVEHTKRYTTTGMGTDQGKTSNLNAMVAMAKCRGVTIPEVGTTTFRPPFTPLTFGSVVGHNRRELFLQKRKTAMHAWHDDNGAVYEDVGDWKRPFYFPKDGESMHDAVQRETKAVRTSAGILDASTLGKIDIQGKDAAWLLNMLYTNAWTKLQPGSCRYGLMLNEHGMVIDDGVTTCLAPGHYHMTTTSGGAARVMNWIEEWIQTEWPEKEIYATSVTEQWAVAALNGPNSQKILQKLTDTAIDDDFKFMSMKEITVAGIAARVYRISFTGEEAYEINVPARFGLSLFKALMEAGEEFDLTPYGTETMHVLRAEKGFIIVGQDTDGTVTPLDLGMNWIVKKKGDFFGKRSFERSDTSRAGRKQLVGVLTKDPKIVLQEGAHLVEKVEDKPPMNMLGHVTSSYMSPNLGRSIAMALVKDGFNRQTDTLFVPTIDGQTHEVTITDTNFYDPKKGENDE